MSATPKLPYCWVAGDVLPEIVITYVDQNLTGYTITLHLLRRDESVVVIPATPLDLTQGRFKFEWGAEDLVAGINQEVEIKFVNGEGEPLTSGKVLMDVRENLA